MGAVIAGECSCRAGPGSSGKAGRFPGGPTESVEMFKLEVESAPTISWAATVINMLILADSYMLNFQPERVS